MCSILILSEFQRGHPVVCRSVRAHAMEEVATTVISVEEQLSGWYALLRRANDAPQLARVYQRLTDCVSCLSRMRVLSFTESAIERHRALRSLKLNVGKMDLRIAAIALEHGAIVVTRNLRDFEHVPGLEVKDWSVES